MSYGLKVKIFATEGRRSGGGETHSGLVSAGAAWMEGAAQ